MKRNNHLSAFFLLPGICYLTEFVVWSSYPPSHSLNAILGGLWTLGQIGILLILSYLYRWKIASGSKWKALGVSIAAAGAISYSINYFFGYWLHMNTKMFLPLGALLSGIGMVVTGIQVLVGKRWPGFKGTLPLFVGLYPFLVMFPLLVITGHPDLVAIMGWGVPWLFLGIGMATERSTLKTRPQYEY
ncbi:hypothetical protein [Adhaeribacter pallidiroseus]|uniref:Uncharacterized protein n=1 Tax=Adhaeribacter pallidiroseus TaxID=2072847 RepID=A0A369QPJ0_9BACT|nr:hypothetical protein [Adhaeribacter pallidiroseus]RDC66242.1 hypothetical protein AHMF7616_04873 [Adhaeribacter pallidiroseus]